MTRHATEAGAPRERAPRRHTLVRGDGLLITLAVLATLLSGVAAVVAWTVPDFYRADPAGLRPQLYGQDLVTILVVAVIAISIARTLRGSVRARIVMLGGMLYVAYGSMMYAFGVRFNELFLVYVAALGFSTFALAIGVARFPLADVGHSIPARRSLAVFLLAVPLLFGTIWLIDIGAAYASGGVPNAAREVQMPTSPVHVEDLAFVLPLSAAAAVLLWRRSPWAAVFSGIILVKVITICLAMLAMGVMAWRDARPVNVPVAFAALVTLGAASTLAWAYFRGLPVAPPSGRRRADRIEAGTMTRRVILQACLAWLALAAMAILNGAFREAVLSRAFDEPVARALSLALLIALVFAVSLWTVARKWRALSYRALLGIGAGWALGSALFELGLGRLVLDVPWSELLAAYDVAAGQYWILAPIAMAIGPAVAKRVLARRAVPLRLTRGVHP